MRQDKDGASLRLREESCSGGSTPTKATKATEVTGAGEGAEDEAGRPGVSTAPSKNVVGEKKARTGGRSRVRGGSLTVCRGGTCACVRACEKMQDADSGVPEMANKHMARCSTSLATRGVKSKPQ